MIETRKYYNADKVPKEKKVKKVRFSAMGTQGTLLTGSTTGKVFEEFDIPHAKQIPKFNKVQTKSNLDGSTVNEYEPVDKEFERNENKPPDFFAMSDTQASTTDFLSKNQNKKPKVKKMAKIRKIHTGAHVNGTTLNQHEKVSRSFQRNEKEAPDFFAMKYGGSTTDFQKIKKPIFEIKFNPKINDYKTNANLVGSTTKRQIVIPIPEVDLTKSREEKREIRLRAKEAARIEKMKDKEFAEKMKMKTRKQYKIKIPSNGTQLVPKKYGGKAWDEQ